ncbi:MAG: S1 RNA-binding domain-containing protein, partial [Campylobacteraceae bacterium]
NFYLDKTMEVGNTLDVFIYTDSDDRLIASTIYPIARLGEFALLEVKDVTNFGAFVDWGMQKDLLVPVKYQKSPFKIGEKRVIFVALDEMTNRLIGVEKFGKFLPKSTPKYEKNEEVELFILAKTPLGYKALINDRYEGMLYQTQIFEKLEIGQRIQGYIKNIRSDKRIDLSLQPIGEAANDLSEKKLLEVLREHNYEMPYNTKTDPQIIYDIFGLSKKSFKSSLNKLVNEGLVEVGEFGIRRKA